MLTNPRTLFLGTLLALALSQKAGAALPGREVRVSIQVIVNPVEGSPRTGCEASAKDKAQRTEWWAAFAQVKPHPETGWEVAGDGVRCGGGSF